MAEYAPGNRKGRAYTNDALRDLETEKALIVWLSETRSSFDWQGTSFFLHRGRTLSSCSFAQKSKERGPNGIHQLFLTGRHHKSPSSEWRGIAEALCTGQQLRIFKLR